MIDLFSKIQYKKTSLVVVLVLIALLALIALSGCASLNAPDGSTSSTNENVAQEANNGEEGEERLQVDASVDNEDSKEDGSSPASEETCFVVSNVVIEDVTGNKVAEIDYTLDERGGTEKVVSESTADDGKAVWNYTLNDDGLPATVDFEYTSSEGDDAYQTVYEYGDVENGLPASESSIAQYMEEDGVVNYKYVYDYEYEDGFLSKTSYRIFEDGKEITTQSKSQTYDPQSGVLKKYESNYMTINFKGKKNSEGQIQTLDFTIGGQVYSAKCTYNDNGTIAALNVSIRGVGDGFTIVPEYTEIANPYPQVRANSKAFIWNGLTAELGL